MNGLVYILEDDSSITGLIKVALEMNDVKLLAFGDIKSFKNALLDDKPDVALLDIMLPDGSGLDVLKYIKEKYPDISCMVISALGKEEDKINGLNLGADDYISKPFSVLELVARVNARLRNKKKTELLKVDNITLNKETMRCTVDGKEIQLNRKEYLLLSFLMENKGKVLSRERLLTEVWGYDVGETRTLDTHIARLRKLGVKIDTIFGVGYRL